MEMKDLLGNAYREGMTPEEMIAALREIPLPEDRTAEVERLSAALTKSNSEAAEYKRRLRARLTEEEAARQKEKEDRESLQRELEALRRESAVSKRKAKLTALGYDEALAEDTAEAFADGQTDRVLANMKKHLDAFEKKLRADVLKGTPRPVPDGKSTGMTVDAFRKLSARERAAYAASHPEEYRALYGGNE